MSQNQLNNANHVVSVFAGNTQCEFAMVAYNAYFIFIVFLLSEKNKFKIEKKHQNTNWICKIHKKTGGPK